MIICDHRNAAGQRLQTFLHGDVTVCPRCVEGVKADPVLKPITNMAQMLAQMDYAAVEARAMTAMMKEVGIEFVQDEAMGTAEQFEEFKKRWTEKYPDRSFVAMYGSGPQR